MKAGTKKRKLTQQERNRRISEGLRLAWKRKKEKAMKFGTDDKDPQRGETVARIHNFGSGDWAFHCPGCGYGHSFRVNGDSTRPQWTWNGSLDKPTFTPSLMVNGSVPEQRCHSNVTDGRIQFHGDSHHALAGQTVDLPDWEENA